MNGNAQQAYAAAQSAPVAAPELVHLGGMAEQLAHTLHATADRIEKVLDRIAGTRPQAVGTDKAELQAGSLLGTLRQSLGGANSARDRLVEIANRLESIG